MKFTNCVSFHEIKITKYSYFDEHIEKILEAKNRLKLSVLDMTLTISDAVSQLDGEKK